jgi:hypothetical protein
MNDSSSGLPPRPDDEDNEPGPRRGALVALIVIAVLVAGGIWLAQTLHNTGRIQDCVMAGRSNCAPVDTNAK